MDLMRRIESLYRELPEVACRCCGYCCVSPTCTLVEFVYLMRSAQTLLTPERLRALLTAPPVFHEEHEGNLCCPFFDRGRCVVHAVRTGSCRVFGLSSLSEFGVNDLVECPNTVAVIGGRSDREFVRDWIDRLFALNAEVYACNAAPYFVRGLNLQSWLDVYFDDTLDFDVFRRIREAMRTIPALPLSGTARPPQTRLRDKVDRITVFSSMLGLDDVETMESLLVSIRDDYPLTGTYFLEEARRFLREIRGGGREK